jgi:ABC-2 type transport system ATP-binding protein
MFHMNYVITTEQLTKKYKNFTSVNNVSLHIRKGSIYGFIGPNGAGKSTTMKMLLGLTAPTKGSFTIDGKHFPDDRLAILKEIGSFIESPSFYANLTGRENLDIIRRILRLSKSSVEDALELVGLTEFGDRLAKKYSLGMKQRLGLAGALLGRPPILILDEPTNGLDPSGIHEIRSLVKSLLDLYDCTILISSHMLSEIELIADDIGILNHGRLLFEGSLDDLRQNALQSGFAADNLEDVFLSIVEKDNAAREQSYEDTCHRASERETDWHYSHIVSGWYFGCCIRFCQLPCAKGYAFEPAVSSNGCAADPTLRHDYDTKYVCHYSSHLYGLQHGV